MHRLALENRGFFSDVNSSASEVEAWTKKDDTIQAFLDDAFNEGVVSVGGKIKLYKGENGKIERVALWELFHFWQEKNVNALNKIGRNTFYSQIEKLGYAVKYYNGIRYFYGIFVSNAACGGTFSDSV